MLVVLGSNVKHDSAVGFPNPKPCIRNCGNGSFQAYQRCSVLNPVCAPVCVYWGERSKQKKGDLVSKILKILDTKKETPKINGRGSNQSSSPETN